MKLIIDIQEVPDGVDIHLHGAAIQACSPLELRAFNAVVSAIDGMPPVGNGPVKKFEGQKLMPMPNHRG